MDLILSSIYRERVGLIWMATNMVGHFVTLFLQMADPVDALHAVLMICSNMNQADCNMIINMEGFNYIDNLGIMENDKDINEMAGEMHGKSYCSVLCYDASILMRRCKNRIVETKL